MFYNILDEKRIDILPLLKNFKDRFYLAGGTGLALQIGHRDSIDFDFFMEDHFDTQKLYLEVLEIFEGRKIVKTLEEKDSLNVVVDDEIKLSFLRFPYSLIGPIVEDENLRIASLEDIGCMKLSAIVGRSVEKDYVDIYFILQRIPLKELLTKTEVKMPDLDPNLILKSLVYFDDVEREEIIFKNNFNIDFPVIEEFLRGVVLSL